MEAEPPPFFFFALKKKPVQQKTEALSLARGGVASKWFIKKGCQKHPFPAWPSASNPQFPFKPCRIPPFLSYHLFLVGRNGDPFFSGTRAPPHVSGNRKRKRSLFAWAPRTNKALTQVGTPHPPNNTTRRKPPWGREHTDSKVCGRSINNSVQGRPANLLKFSFPPIER